MAREGGARLDVDGGVGERLGEGAAPAVKVRRLGMLGGLEQFDLARRQGPGQLVSALLGVPGLDTERAAQVAAERLGMADLALCLASTTAAQGREHRARRGPSLALPPVPQERAEHGRDFEQLRPAGLHTRSPATSKLAGANLESLPGQLVQVVRAQASETAGDHGHGLPFEHGQLAALLGMLIGQINQQLGIRQDGCFLGRDLWKAGHGRIITRVDLDRAFALQGLKHEPDRLADVGDGLSRLALSLGEVQRFVDMAGLDGSHIHVLEHGKGVGPEPGQLIFDRNHAVCRTLCIHPLGCFAKGLRPLCLRQGRSLVRYELLQLALCDRAIGRVQRYTDSDALAVDHAPDSGAPAALLPNELASCGAAHREPFRPRGNSACLARMHARTTSDILTPVAYATSSSIFRSVSVSMTVSF